MDGGTGKDGGHRVALKGLNVLPHSHFTFTTYSPNSRSLVSKKKSIKKLGMPIMIKKNNFVGPSYIFTPNSVQLMNGLDTEHI